MLTQQLLSLDLREPSRQLPSLSLPMRTAGYTNQLHNKTFSLSSLSCDSSESTYLTSSQWGQQPESPIASQLTGSSLWGKSAFFAQRSVSMVEGSSGTPAGLGWPRNDMRLPQSDISPTALNTGSSLSTSSLSSSSSSSSRYKTELCRSFTESGLCKYGGKCQFAHGPEELRDLNRHPKYKTELCRTFHTIGFCPYGMRCHFVHNSEEERKQSISRSSSSSSSGSSSSIPPQPLCSSNPNRPPLVRQSFSFAGFPSPLVAPHSSATPTSFAPAPSASRPSCADISDLLSSAFLDMDSAFEPSPANKYQALGCQTMTADPRSPFLPSPDSGCSPCGISPTGSPSLRLSPGATGVFSQPLGARSLSYTSLSDQDQDQDQDGGSSASSLSGSDTCSGVSEVNGKRLAVFSQLSVPDDSAGVCL